MGAIKTVNVTATIHGQDGQPLAGAAVTAQLNRLDVDSGYVAPAAREFIADAAGVVVMPLWPNALGATASQYRISAIDPATGMTVLDVIATIPNNNCNLYTVANLPPFPGKTDGQIAVDAAAASAAAASVSETNAATSESNAAASAAGVAANAAAAATSETNAAGSATAAAASAAAAGSSETNAAASESNAAGSATAAAASATAAGSSETNAAASESNAAGSATAAAADRVAVAADKTATANDRAAADAAKVGAQTAAANAVAVVAGGNGSIAPAPGNYPLADATGHIDGGWIDTFPAVSQALPSSLNIVDATISLGKNDSDGRAWAKRCQHTSWYSESRSTGAYISALPDGYASAALAVAAGAVVGDYYYNTTSAKFEEVTNAGTGTEASVVTYRAGSAEFPQDVVITAEAARVIIWDITGAQPEMWMVFDSFGVIGWVANGASSMFARACDAHIVLGTYGMGGFVHISLLADDMRLGFVGYELVNRKVSSRNGATPYIPGDGYGVVNNKANDVAITVLPDAPIDSATGLPVPTIAVATAGGVSVIKDDGTVVASAITTPATRVTFDALNRVRWVYLNACACSPPPPLSAGFSGEGSGSTMFAQASYSATRLPMVPPASSGSINFAMPYISGSSGLFRFNDGGSSLAAFASAAAITSAYNTGYMVGDIRRCYLANSLTADRSVKAGSLTVVGAVTETVNAGGRNVYSGFSAANYLQEASHTDFNAIGTGDFSIIMSGVKWGTAGAARTLLSIGDGISAGSISVSMSTANLLLLFVHNGTSLAAYVSGTAGVDSSEHTVEIKRVSGVVFIVVDGIATGSAAVPLTISNATGFLRIGNRQDLSQPWAGGQCSCVRISATAPTAEQSKFIADQEAKLSGGAACLLSSSSSVSALSYDADTDVLHVGNGTNIDQFVGLQRVGSRAIASGTLAAIAASGGQVIEVGNAGGQYDAPAISIKAELTAAQQKVAQAQQGTVVKMIASDAASVLTCPQGFKPIRVTSASGTYISLSTNAPVFDGFLWSITSGLAASTNYDVEMVRV